MDSALMNSDICEVAPNSVLNKLQSNFPITSCISTQTAPNSENQNGNALHDTSLELVKQISGIEAPL